jgi:hypothetical protein
MEQGDVGRPPCAAPRHHRQEQLDRILAALDEATRNPVVQSSLCLKIGEQRAVIAQDPSPERRRPPPHMLIIDVGLMIGADELRERRMLSARHLAIVHHRRQAGKQSFAASAHCQHRYRFPHRYRDVSVWTRPHGPAYQADIACSTTTAVTPRDHAGRVWAVRDGHQRAEFKTAQHKSQRSYDHARSPWRSPAAECSE